jgi:hypothetical protein
MPPGGASHVNLDEESARVHPHERNSSAGANKRDGFLMISMGLSKLWPSIAWPLRTALSCWLSSLVYLTPLDENGNGPLEGRLLAPITGAAL